MIALVYFLVSIICVLVYMIMRANWRINALEDQLEKQADTLIGVKTLHDRNKHLLYKNLHDFEESANFDPPSPKHKFVECLGDYDLYCNGVKARFVHLMTAKHNMIICPICGEPANFEPEEK